MNTNMNDKLEPNNSSDLFDGTAIYYKQYRVPYSQVLIDSLIETLRLDGLGRLLDVGCGTGEVIEAIGEKYDSVVGIDPNQAMLTETHQRIEQAGLKNFELRHKSAEDISEFRESFRTVTFGASFHWTDRLATAKSVMGLLEPGGAIVLLGSNSPWQGSEEWQELALEQLKSYLGQQRRAGIGHFTESQVRHETVLEQTGFAEIQTVEFDLPYSWTLNNFIGYLYSTSFASKEILGDQAQSFETSIRQALLNYDANGIYKEIMKFYYIVGWKR